MLIWKRWGILAIVIGFGSLVMTQLLVDAVWGEGTYTADSGLWAGVGSLLGGAVTLAVGLRLNRWARTEEGPWLPISQLPYRERHTLFWVPMEYWGALLTMLGLIMIIGRAI